MEGDLIKSGQGSNTGSAGKMQPSPTLDGCRCEAWASAGSPSAFFFVPSLTNAVERRSTRARSRLLQPWEDRIQGTHPTAREIQNAFSAGHIWTPFSSIFGKIHSPKDELATRELATSSSRKAHLSSSQPGPMDARRGGSEIASCELARSKLKSSPTKLHALSTFGLLPALPEPEPLTHENRLDIHTLPSPPTSSSRHHQRQPETCRHLCLPLFARPPSPPHQTTPFSDHHNINTLINSITTCDRCWPARFLSTRSPPVSSDPRQPSVISIRIDDGIPRSARFESRTAPLPPFPRSAVPALPVGRRRRRLVHPSQVAMLPSLRPPVLNPSFGTFSSSAAPRLPQAHCTADWTHLRHGAPKHPALVHRSIPPSLLACHCRHHMCVCTCIPRIASIA